jgi:hypothetical protein
MKKSSLPKSTEVLAFLKANSGEFFVQEVSKASGRNLPRKPKTAKERNRKAL